MGVEIPADLNQFVASQMATGEFPSERYVVAKALRLLQKALAMNEQQRQDVLERFNEFERAEFMSGRTAIQALHGLFAEIRPRR
jgi:Arc/MetJ-type ribon-helix-helix transcriptional regulator